MNPTAWCASSPLLCFMFLVYEIHGEALIVSAAFSGMVNVRMFVGSDKIPAFLTGFNKFALRRCVASQETCADYSYKDEIPLLKRYVASLSTSKKTECSIFEKNISLFHLTIWIGMKVCPIPPHLQLISKLHTFYL